MDYDNVYWLKLGSNGKQY